MFAVIRHYHFDPKDGAEIDRQIREEFVPIVKNAKGFVRYYWLDTGNGEGASIGVFKDKAGANESVRLAADYVKDHLSKLRNPRLSKDQSRRTIDAGMSADRRRRVRYRTGSPW
ncbi:MAG TPA: hypothetical protein VGM65_12830 [Candidatus Udaeobacter sp.]|jgi:hypothetical protein